MSSKFHLFQKEEGEKNLFRSREKRNCGKAWKEEKSKFVSFLIRGLTLYQDTYILVSSYNKEVREVAGKSRANYFKERRKQSDTKAFYVEVDKKKLETLEGKLSERGQTKKEWLNEKIDKELEE